MGYKVKAIYLLMLLRTSGPHNLHEEPLIPFYDLFDEVYPTWGELADNDKDLAKHIIEDMKFEIALERVHLTLE